MTREHSAWTREPIRGGRGRYMHMANEGAVGVVIGWLARVFCNLRLYSFGMNARIC